MIWFRFLSKNVVYIRKISSNVDQIFASIKLSCTTLFGHFKSSFFIWERMRNYCKLHTYSIFLSMSAYGDNKLVKTNIFSSKQRNPSYLSNQDKAKMASPRGWGGWAGASTQTRQQRLGARIRLEVRPCAHPTPRRQISQVEGALLQCGQIKALLHSLELSGNRRPKCGHSASPPQPGACL